MTDTTPEAIERVLALLSTPPIDNPEEQWTAWRKYIAEGGTASWPRDQFGMMLDYVASNFAEAAALITALAAERVSLSDNHPIQVTDDIVVDIECYMARGIDPELCRLLDRAVAALKDRAQKDDGQ